MRALVAHPSADAGPTEVPNRVTARRGMADHLDSPNLTSPAMDARVDITDIYAFQKPNNRDKSILILNVNPLAPTHADEFRHDARYELLIDNNGDARPDVKFSIRFSRKENGQQYANIRCRSASDGSEDDDDDDAGVVIEQAPVSFGPVPKVTTDGDYRCSLASMELAR